MLIVWGVMLFFIFIASILGFTSVLISPTNKLFMGWSNLTEKQRSYGCVFYLCLTVLCVLAFFISYSFMSLSEEGAGIFLAFLSCFFVLFSILECHYWKIIKTGKIPAKKQIKVPLQEHSAVTFGDKPENTDTKSKIPAHNSTSAKYADDNLHDIECNIATGNINTYNTSSEEAIPEKVNDIEHTLLISETQKVSNDEEQSLMNASDSIHQLAPQRARQRRANSVIFAEIDYEHGTGIALGNSKTFYNVTLYSCTCRDYFTRRLPCKHMYKLASELGKFKLDNKELF